MKFHLAKAFDRRGPVSCSCPIRLSHVVVNGPSAAEGEAGEAVCREIRRAGADASFIQAEIGAERECERLADEAREWAGGIDILVNNAGIAHNDQVEEMAPSTWDQVLSVHARGTFLMCHFLLPHMYEAGFGRIINTASQLAYKGAPGLSAYTAAKGAVLSFTRSLALEIGDRNVRVNCVAPGATLTPILDAVEPDVLDAIKGGIPVGHLAQVDDIVPAYIFLASRSGDHFQGQCISPNGGDQFL